MKVSEWAYEYIIAFSAADKAIGKAFIKTLAPFAGDDENCLEAMQLVPIGQPDAAVAAYATVCPCKKDFYDFVKAAKEDAPFSDSRYDYGKNKSITLNQFNTVKAAVLFIEVRIRRDLTTNEVIARPISIEQYLANKGYEQKILEE